MKTVRHPAKTEAGPASRGGLSVVEVLVAVAIMATVALALFGLQAAALRAARTAATTRQQAAALRYEADLARVVAVAASSCRGNHAAGACAITTTCLDEGAGSADCRLLRTTIAVTSSGGRTVTATTVGYAPLEAAPVEVPEGARSP